MRYIVCLITAFICSCLSYRKGINDNFSILAVSVLIPIIKELFKTLQLIETGSSKQTYLSWEI